MPLIDRQLTQSIPALSLPRVKLEAPSFLDSSSSEEGREGPDGKWSVEENLRFVIFVHYYQEIFSSRHRRRTTKIFKTFHEYLQDRSAAQCRSHYQKIIQKFKTVAKLRRHFEQLHGRDNYQRQFEDFKNLWEATHPPLTDKDLSIKELKEIAVQTEPEMAIPACFCQGASYQNPGMMLGEINPYVFWNQMGQVGQMGMGCYYLLPARSEETMPDL